MLLAFEMIFCCDKEKNSREIHFPSRYKRVIIATRKIIAEVMQFHWGLICHSALL